MRRTALVCAFAVLLCAAPNAFAQGGAAQCRQPVKLSGEQRVSSLVLPKGNYRITVQETGDLTCDQARASFKELLAAPGSAVLDPGPADASPRARVRVVARSGGQAGSSRQTPGC